jgi:hypothetical protein
VHAVLPPEAAGQRLAHGHAAGQAGVGDGSLTQDMPTTETPTAAQGTIGTRTYRQHDALEALAAHPPARRGPRLLQSSLSLHGR